MQQRLSQAHKLLVLVAVALGVVMASYAFPARAQVLHASGPRPSFEVASIRPSPPDEQPGRMVGPDRFVARVTTVKEMLMYAYGLGFDGELSGGPHWIATDTFTIEATPGRAQADELSKMSRDDRDEQMRLMMQSLLEERFGLKVSFEKKDLPVYELVVAKGGLKCPKDDSSPPAIANTARPRFGWSAAPAPPPPPPGWHPPIAPEEIHARAVAPLHFRTKGWPFWLVVTMLSHQPELGGRMVIDKTGLDGSYDCQATWAREGGDGPSFFTAIQDQMGLKLEPEKAPVEVLVVDHVERPSEN